MESEGDEPILRHPKQSKPTNSILTMPNLPAELITEILLRLSVKSLLKFRSVSKSWLTLISSPDFVKDHLLLSASNKDYTHHGVMFNICDAKYGIRDCSLSALLYHPVTEAFDLDYPGKSGKRPDAYPRVVGSVNGLICLAIILSNGLDGLFLWNPSIRKYKKLLNFGLDVSRRYHEHEFVYFKFGFAYDELQDDYKVVGIIPVYRNGRSCHAEVKIYSLKSDSWRRIDDLAGRELVGDSAKFVKGKLHWLDKQWNIISIDLADEKWAEVEQPSCFKRCQPFTLGVFQSDISVFYNYAWTHVDIWVMKEYGIRESWTKMLTIKSPNDSLKHIYYPLISNEGEILLRFGSYFTKCNPKDDSIRFLAVSTFAPCLEAEIYVKSLVCPF